MALLFLFMEQQCYLLWLLYKKYDKMEKKEGIVELNMKGINKI